MKHLPLLGLAAFAALANSQVQAAPVYVDANYNGNTFNATTSSATDWTVDPGVNPNGAPNGDNLWGQRTSGPGASAFGTGAWQVDSSESEPTIRTTVTGLAANAVYGGLRLYFIGKESTGNGNQWFIDVSIDGTNFVTFEDGPAANPVDTSNGGIGAAITPGATDIRYYVDLPNGTTDGSGNLSVWVRGGEGANNRTVYDGIAYDSTAISEPSDEDGDGITDDYELANTPDPGSTTALDPTLDDDGDGISNLQEYLGLDDLDADHGYGQTRANLADTDDDGLDDDEEIGGTRNPYQPGAVEGEAPTTAPGAPTNPNDADSDDDGILDGEEVEAGNDGFVTNALEPDTDGDDWRDDFEVANVASGFDPTVNDGAEDPDSDDLDNDAEFALNTDPLDPDSDDDDSNDGAEDLAGTDPNDPDSDDDGLLDGVEDNGGTYESPTKTGSDPLFADTDDDLIPDGVEVTNAGLGLDPNVDNYDDDTDGDTITNGFEIETTLTDFLKADTDDDGLNDNIEDVNMDGIVDGTETDPNDPDTDNDGLLDGVEDNGGIYVGPGMTGSDPLYADTDDDLIPDGVEVANVGLGLDPNVDNYDDDTDGDTITNGFEIETTLTNMFSTDSDNDGLADNIEDVDQNGYDAGVETNALNPDTDGDCLMDGVEDNGGVLVSPSMTGTDPLVADGLDDLDTDGFSFATEVLYGTDPADSGDSPTGMLPDILFVGGNATGDQGSDDEAQHFLACRYGIEAITYIQASVSTVEDTTGRDLLVVSSTPGSDDIRNKFANVAVPTVNWEEAVSDNGSGEYGMSSEVMSKTVTMTEVTLLPHLITEGLPSTIEVFKFNATNFETAGTGMLFPGLTSVANAVDGTAINGPRTGQPIAGNAMAFIADTGDALDPGAAVTGNVAPARRVMFMITDNTFASLSDDAKELLGRSTDWAMDLLVAAPTGIEVTGAFNGAAFEVTAINLDPAVTYELRRSANGQTFSMVAGSTFDGAATHVFVDAAPPADTTMLYQIWTP